MSTAFQFCTAVVGERYRRVGEALIASFSDFHHASQLHVFTDLEIDAPAQSRTSWAELVGDLPEYYKARPRVFKLRLLREMFDRYPSQEVVWIDADSVVLAPLTDHLRPGSLNVMALDRHGQRPEPLGNGLVVTSSRYVTSNFFSVPSVDCVDDLDRLLLERLSWPDAESLPGNDQVLVNHLVLRGEYPVNWIGGEGTGWFSTGCAVELQDARTHSEVSAGTDGREILYRGEPIVLFSPTKLLVDLSFMNGFDSYPPLLRERLRERYGWNDLPFHRRLLGRLQRTIVWDLSRWMRGRLRSIGPLARLVRTLRGR